MTDHEERERRMAERQAEQERLHEADPHNVPKYIPVDDEEFGTEAYTAGWQDEDDDEPEMIDCGYTEIIDICAWEADGYRITSDGATPLTAAEPRWVVAHCWMRGDEYVYDALTEPMTLAEAEAEEQNELAALIEQAESTEDYQERERLIDSLGALVRQQIAQA